MQTRTIFWCYALVLSTAACVLQLHLPFFETWKQTLFWEYTIGSTLKISVLKIVTIGALHSGYLVYSRKNRRDYWNKSLYEYAFVDFEVMFIAYIASCFTSGMSMYVLISAYMTGYTGAALLCYGLLLIRLLKQCDAFKALPQSAQQFVIANANSFGDSLVRVKVNEVMSLTDAVDLREVLEHPLPYLHVANIPEAQRALSYLLANATDCMHMTRKLEHRYAKAAHEKDVVVRKLREERITSEEYVFKLKWPGIALPKR